MFSTEFCLFEFCEMATKFVDEKWERIDCSNCEYAQFAKFCSVVMKEKTIEKVNNDNMKVERSCSNNDMKGDINYDVVACEPKRVECTLSVCVEDGTSYSNERGNGG